MFWHIQALFTVCRCHSRHFNQAVTNIVGFTQLYFESLYFLCVCTGFTFNFYQSCAAVFAESAFFLLVHFHEEAMSSWILSEASFTVLAAVTCVMLGFLNLWCLFGFAIDSAFYILILLSTFIFVFWSTSVHFLL